MGFPIQEADRVMGWSLKPLSNGEIKAIHEASLTLLEEVGIKIPSEKALHLLEGAGASIDPEEQVARIPEGLLNECLRKMPGEFDVYYRDGSKRLRIGGDAIYFGSVGRMVRMRDPETGEIRRLTLRDVEELARLADALEHVDFFTVGEPLDVPLELRGLQLIYATLRNSVKPPIVELFTAWEVRAGFEMLSAVAGGPEELRRRPIGIYISVLNSPLYFDSKIVEALIEASRCGLPIWAESGPIAGANSPITLAGTLTLNNAEVLGALVISTLAGGDEPLPFIYGTWARSIDLRSGDISLGNPEFSLLKASTAQMARFYGLPSGGGGIITDSKTVDEQSGYEKLHTALIPALAGLNLISGMGLLAADAIASPEQLIIDDEVAALTKRILRGLRVDEERIALEEIKEVRWRGDFLGRRHTLRYGREEHWVPRLSDRSRPEAWERLGAPSLNYKAGEEVRRLLREHQPKPLPRDVEDEIKRIMRSYLREA